MAMTRTAWQCRRTSCIWSWREEGKDLCPVLFSEAGCAGVSVKYGYDMNSLAVPRKAKEAIGGIAALKKPGGGALTINVEYNLLDPLLRASGWADGDVNDDTGYSPYPGKNCWPR